MRLVRFETDCGPRIGAIRGDVVVDLQAALKGSSEQSELPESMAGLLARGAEGLDLAAEALARSERSGDDRCVLPLKQTRLLAPIGDPQKIICVGQNYRDHCVEQNIPLPKTAIIFAKYASALIGPGAPIVIPKLSSHIDYEAEMAFVIGKRARHVSSTEAREYVAGYMCMNDVSARDIQRNDGQWVRAKTFDTFAPTGPALVTIDEVPNPHDLNITCTVNDQVLQSSNTRNLIFDVDYLVEYLSAVMTLEPGDIVTTGTPGGVGVYRTPQVFLKPGDQVTVSIQGIGSLTNPVRAE